MLMQDSMLLCIARTKPVPAPSSRQRGLCCSSDTPNTALSVSRQLLGGDPTVALRNNLASTEPPGHTFAPRLSKWPSCSATPCRRVKGRILLLLLLLPFPLLLPAPLGVMIIVGLLLSPLLPTSPPASPQQNLICWRLRQDQGVKR